MASDADYKVARYNWYQWQKRAAELQSRLAAVERTLQQIENPERASYLTPIVLVGQLRQALDADPVEHPDTRIVSEVRLAFDQFLDSRNRLFSPSPLIGPLRNVQSALDSGVSSA